MVCTLLLFTSRFTIDKDMGLQCRYDHMGIFCHIGTGSRQRNLSVLSIEFYDIYDVIIYVQNKIHHVLNKRR